MSRYRGTRHLDAVDVAVRSWLRPNVEPAGHTASVHETGVRSRTNAGQEDTMTKEAIDDASDLAERFISAYVDYTERLKVDPAWSSGCKESAALRRASLDLTRALARMRRP